MDRAVYEENLIGNIIASIEKHGGKECLSSIILTGSFGRGEPTYVVEPAGGLQLKSDVEIALIFPKFSQKNAVTTLIQTVSSEFEENLNLMSINEKRVRKAYNFNFSLRVPRYKTIFTYDLFNGSKTIWGRDFIGEKKIALSNIDPYEAKRLVANRIGELVYLQDIAESDKRAYLRMQWKGKLVMSIVSAWLILEGEYVSSYHGQYESLKKSIEKVENLLGKGFFAEYEKVFEFLRENGAPYEIADDLLTSYIRNIDQYLKKIKNPKVNSTSRLMKYVLKYMKTGGKYGIVGFENNILQALISDYGKQSKRLVTDAEIWRRVLY